MRAARAVVVVAVCMIWAVLPRSMAITDEETFRQLRFNFINPGARSLGFGGAFIALADDATAAEANPAGLMQLSAPEFFVELRHIGSDDTTTTGGFSQPGFFQVDFASQNTRRSTTTPSFISYVAPFRKVALGFSRQEVLDTQMSVTSSFSSGSPAPGAIPTVTEGRGEASLKVTNWNVALAWRPVSWLSFGVTSSIGELEVQAIVDNTFLDTEGTSLCVTGVVGDPDGAGPLTCPDNPVLQVAFPWFDTRVDAEDTEFTYSAGILIAPSDQYSIGLVYRSDTKYEFEQQRTEGISGEVTTGYFANPTAVLDQTLHLPTRYGLGLKWRPTPHWTLAADVVRVKYSDLLDGLQIKINALSSRFNDTLGGPLVVPPLAYTIDDVTEVHAGAEYLFSRGKTPWALRFGAHTDPDNVMRDNNDVHLGALQGRDDELHYTAGAGVVLQEGVQFDLAVSVSSLGTETVVSSIYRF